MLRPLFEFSGACAGCGETPYVKLVSQLFGDPRLRRQRHRLLLHLRRQPAHDAVGGGRRGRGPAWCNSLFEDNAEFGLGMRVTIDKQEEFAMELVKRLESVIRRRRSPTPSSRRTIHRGGHQRRSGAGAELKKKLAGAAAP